MKNINFKIVLFCSLMLFLTGCGYGNTYGYHKLCDIYYIENLESFVQEITSDITDPLTTPIDKDELQKKIFDYLTTNTDYSDDLSLKFLQPRAQNYAYYCIIKNMANTEKYSYLQKLIDRLSTFYYKDGEERYYYIGINNFKIHNGNGYFNNKYSDEVYIFERLLNFILDDYIFLTTSSYSNSYELYNSLENRYSKNNKDRYKTFENDIHDKLAYNSCIYYLEELYDITCSSLIVRSGDLIGLSKLSEDYNTNIGTVNDMVDTTNTDDISTEDINIDNTTDISASNDISTDTDDDMNSTLMQILLHFL